MSIYSIPCCLTAAWCWGFDRMASNPPWTLGCRVFTRPSSISGNPVKSETSLTFRQFSRSNFAVPPVESSSTCSAASLDASSSTPVLSLTLINAREILRMGTSMKSWESEDRSQGKENEGLTLQENRRKPSAVSDQNNQAAIRSKALALEGLVRRLTPLVILTPVFCLLLSSSRS